MKAQGRREETLCSIFNDSSDFKLCGTIYVMKCNMQCKCKINNKLSRKIWEIKPSMVAFFQNASKVTFMNFIDIVWGNNKQKQPPVAESCNFIKRETLAQVLSYEICEIFNNIFITEHLWVSAFE